jgi:uncharacterized protein YcbK (DUF882 family)
MFVAAGRGDMWSLSPTALAADERAPDAIKTGGHVTVKVAHEISLCSRQAIYGCSAAALLAFFSCATLKTATAADTRTISFHHTHTSEDLTITYKVNGRYDEDALAKINQLMRDWRQNQPIRMDPELIDLLWEVHRETGSKEPIWVVCGYRSPATNEGLRKRSSGVAKFSQHTLGRAIDFYIPGVPLDQLRAAGLRAQRGGVGFYPTSGSPFVHMDTGSVRHWPRMPEAQLAGVLAKGQLASHSAADARGTQIAQGNISSSRKSVGFLAKLFGGSRDEEEDANTAAEPAPAPAPTAVAAKPKAPATRTAAVAATPETTGEKTASAKPTKPATYQVASADSKPFIKLAETKVAETKPAEGFGLASTTSKPVILASDENPSKRPAQAASLVGRANITANDIINERGFWQGLPSVDPAEAPQAVAAKAAAPPPRRAVTTANADPSSTASITPWSQIDRTAGEPLPSALSYAAQPTPIAAARAVSMGSTTSRTASTDSSVAAKRSDDHVAAAPSAPPAKLKPSLVRVGDRFNDPWLRAMIVSPSAQSFMRTSIYGIPDFRSLGAQMLKPASAVMMTFADDPYQGMSSEKFGGTAVVFTSTVAFNTPRTAALR